MVFKNNLRLVSFGAKPRSLSEMAMIATNTVGLIDGGGARSISQLEIMGTIMHRRKCRKYGTESQHVMLPCEHFDLMGGSGTGGYVSPSKALFGVLNI